jgi:enamine deaminase RidA (YjgF/YER057c/UK114 family)
VRIGNIVKVGGTVATDENGVVYGEGDLYAQTVYIIRKIEAALAEAGAKLSDVVSTRTFVTNIDDWEGFAKAHAEFFGEVRPTSTMVEVSRLMSPEFLVEIEAEAMIVG